MTGDCWTCGHPSLRREGHAEWCERVAAAVTAENGGVCDRCGGDFTNRQGLGKHRTSRLPCRPTIVAPDASRAPASTADASGTRRVA